MRVDQLMVLNEKQKNFIDKKLERLSMSKFRSSFTLKEREIDYLKKNSVSVVEEHAFKFVRERLAKKEILNDGKQTPMKGHPVFVGQHATGTCCRNCLYKWHHIEKNKELSDGEIKFVVALIMEWIKNNSSR